MSGSEVRKVFRGTITAWQLHHLSISPQKLAEFSEQNNMERMLPLVITGTVKEDPSGRLQAGWHMRTSVLTIFDETEGYCETKASIYLLEGQNGHDVFPDLGDGVFSIFY